MIPMNGSIWEVSHKERTLRCVFGPPDDLAHKIKVICNFIGYKTELAPLSPAVLTRDDIGAGKVQDKLPSIGTT